ncbi:hypothetical protein T4E_8636 [Trichinella pseudospiralis]|uniref:Uncharacterized protein n=1 Tax=Trichinella pseudospiralis TaxID=6337 RepID=A0A0V0Y4C1_TRIPS|nr:hypothetical protein T4E_8636 [Trichinella pseudospiralis]
MALLDGPGRRRRRQWRSIDSDRLAGDSWRRFAHADLCGRQLRPSIFPGVTKLSIVSRPGRSLFAENGFWGLFDRPALTQCTNSAWPDKRPAPMTEIANRCAAALMAKRRRGVGQVSENTWPVGVSHVSTTFVECQ